MNKKGLEFKLAFFALIAVSILILATGAWVNDWGGQYGSGITYDLDGFSTMDDTSSEANSQRTNIIVKSTDTNERFEDTSIRGVFGILNYIYSSFDVVFGEDGMVKSLMVRFGVPDYVWQGIIAMMTIAITFTLVAILFRLARRNA